ncbi:flagellar biogenesis protein [Clostridium thermosuccinogenes]|jgi:flagellar biosynthesis protein|uniref:Flagellar biogenesis protein n=1 Tax=Clostridium thermosuccinogenes TaxID=84032 RepID=A0A2K2FG48_9CLOT|nr:EscU/YscU/HrcU family type III secretion system export apparatus switch protein [Pseudoclostridium thermosuccinogenes]AUS96475.1 flagellar biogenesis protein [Pseudoclostridium thermosuccinogenes]PNT92862.1 flagellar biogenesis protein [Pseudoclostridium thermosuccinogenes]PNT97752.1 flagellar biogenesis protein [Pseudoclostridium thermosuccinogenes]PNT99743.1 flagellar biogenesis protein [Pseudoclostridium thermosuccinogenes]
MNKHKDGKIIEAAALSYTPGEDKAPKLIAAAKGEAAEKIIEKAKENNIPIYKDEGLVSLLGKMRIGSEIPDELYDVVAGILVYVSDMDRIFGEKHGRKK